MSRYDDPGEPEPPAPELPEGPESGDIQPPAVSTDSDQKPPRRAAPAASRRSSRPAGRRWIGGRYKTKTMTLGGLATLLALVLVGASLGVYVKYREVWDSINKVDVSADLHGKRPPADPNAINLLLIGSDTRVGRNGAIGGRTGIGGARSYSVMVVHISPVAHQV